MKIFQSIQVRKSGQTCRDCMHFKNDPSFMEETYRGLTVMSSGFASVRDQDGICTRHALYLSARDSCSGFVHKIAAPPS